MRLIVALGLVLSSSALAAKPAHAPVQAPVQAAPACDRECLRGKVSQVLYALVDHDAKKVPAAANVRVTEDGVEKPLDKVGLVRSVTKLRGYRQDIIDTRAGQAVAGVMVEESGAPILLVVRVKLDAAQAISELELVTTRSRADGMIYNIDAYSGAPAEGMNLPLRADQLAPRDEMIRLAMFYPRGRSNAQTFNVIGTPFAPEAFRLENGALMAGPDCKFAPGCEDIGNQSLAIFKTLGRVTVRDIVVDERMGIVIMRLSWNQRGPGSDRLTAWEMFKVYDGQIHMVQAWMRLFPPALDLGGWPIREGIVQP